MSIQGHGFFEPAPTQASGLIHCLTPPLRLAFSEVFLWIQRTVYRFTVYGLSLRLGLQGFRSRPHTT